MTDNFTANPGTGGDTFRADDIAGVKIPAAKISLGDDGADDGFVSSANPLPVNGTVSVNSTADRTDTIYNGTTALTPKFAPIAASTSGNNTVVAAVTGKKIRVLALKLLSSGTVNAKWQTGASGTDLTGLSYFVANAGEVLPYNPAGWFETTSDTLLNLNLSAAIAVGGHLTYVEV